MAIQSLKPHVGLQPIWANNPLNIPTPVGAWVMNEGSGNKTFDLSRNEIEGTFVNSPTWDGDNIDLDSATSDYISLSSLADSGFDDEATLLMSLALNNAIPSAALDSGLALFGNPDSGKDTHYPFTDENLYISIFATDRLISGFDDSGFDKTQQHDIAIVTSPGAGNYILYRNGNVVTTGTGQNSISITATSNLGKSEGERYLNGKIKWAYVFNRALSPTQIAFLHQNPYYAWDYLDDTLIAIIAAQVAVSGLSIPRPLSRPFSGPLGGI